MSTHYLVFAQAMPGLALELKNEASELGFGEKIAKSLKDGLELRLNHEELWEYSLKTRLAEGIWIRLGKFVARDFDELKAGVRKLPLRAYLPAGSLYRLRVSCKKSKLWHSGAVIEKMGEALSDGPGWVHVGEEENYAELLCRIVRDQAEVSISASGTRLHRRGFRKMAEVASLRETLAFALLRPLLPSLQKSPQLLDAFSGAGTLGLEAALWAHGRLPGEQRRFNFEDFQFHSATDFQELRAEMMATAAAQAPAPELRVYASELSQKALSATRANFESAGLSASLQPMKKSALDALTQIPAGCHLVANPPFGKRLGGSSVFRSFLRAFEKDKQLGSLAFIAGGPAQKALPKKWEPRLGVRNGGLQVGLYFEER